MGQIISSRYSNKISSSLLGDGSYTVPAGIVIDCIQLVPSIDMPAVKIGTTPGGEEVLPETPLVANTPFFIDTTIAAGTTIYYSGITGAVQVTYFKK